MQNEETKQFDEKLENVNLDLLDFTCSMMVEQQGLLEELLEAVSSPAGDSRLNKREKFFLLPPRYG